MLLVAAVILEVRTCWIQGYFIPRISEKATYKVLPGSTGPSIIAPAGPYDVRLGYASLPEFSEKLKKNGYLIKSQARASEMMHELSRRGVFPIFQEKTVAGLFIEDRSGRRLYASSYPGRTFPGYTAIPPVIVNMLLFIENRGLLDEKMPVMNPAVDWVRLAKAFVETGRKVIDSNHSVPGGSTLATQMEKYRHSDGGLTLSMGDKLRQVVSASLKAYHNGPVTIPTRRRIVVEYLNSVPLAAFPGYGEVFGLGDGLWTWYGVELDRVIEALNSPESEPTRLEEKALRLKQILSLLLAHRKPSYYLEEGREALNDKCNAYLRLLEKEAIITAALKECAIRLPLVFRGEPIAPELQAFKDRKASDPVRVRLLSLMGVPSLYDLDRLDMSVKSSLDLPVQHAATDLITRMRDPVWIAEQGFQKHGLLDKGDPAKVVYAFTLYEKTPKGNLLRVQTDSTEQALNVNEGAMLDLGSTAKLRTLIHYLEIIESLHAQFGSLSQEELLKMQPAPKDAIRRWAVSFLSNHPGSALEEMLKASLERKYSANPAERFFTGGGLHTFENFDDKNDHQTFSVREGLQHSVNLVFIRLMRDVVRFHTFGEPELDADDKPLEDRARRMEYLSKYADFEGTKFLKKFYLRYKGRSEKDAFAVLLHSVRPLPRRLAIVYRFVYPEKDPGEFEQFINQELSHSPLDPEAAAKLYESTSPDRFSLSDAGYISGVHPLELWIVSHLRSNPDISWSGIVEQSGPVRQEAYRWLFQTSRKAAQERRIEIIREIEAFVEIHASWKRLGYPFESLVPSYATSIGSSADRPGALAELMGILINDGMRLPLQTIGEIHFGAGTPYETRFELPTEAGERVLGIEVARMVKVLLYEVVGKGTARRVHRAFLKPDGSELPVGGKTGTGDHRHESYDSHGRLISSEVRNRTATFSFILGDRFFGNITAFVPGSAASDYRFTSALPLAVLRLMAPSLSGLLSGDGGEIETLRSNPIPPAVGFEKLGS